MGGRGFLGSVGVGGVCALFVLVLGLGGCGDDQGVQVGLSRTEGPSAGGGMPAPTAGDRITPRPRAPLSGSMSGSRQPVFEWTPPGRATVEICFDRDCAHVVTTAAGNNGEARPDAPLPAGVVFWRVVSNRGTSAVWELVVPGRDSGTSIAWGVMPDYNADGRADIAIGAASGRRVSIFYGGVFGPGFDPDVVLSGDVDFGRALAAIGDVNGDGFGDLAVAAGNAPGAVSIFYGGTSGFQLGPPLYAGPVSRFGTSMASAGDVNGDGYGDLLVGGAEAAQVYLGGAEGLALHPSFGLAGASGSPFGGEANVVQGPADVNADGWPDVFVGGALYLGNGAGFAAQAGFVSGTFGTFAGDHNGDGFVDFGDYLVAPGTPAGIDLQDTLFVQAGEYVFGSAGDFDGDGFSDVISNVSDLVGAPERERLYFGAPGSCGSTGCRRFLPITLPNRTSSGPAPTTFMTGAGDVNGDGTTDLLVAIPGVGAAYLFLGGSDRQPIRFAIRTWTGPVGFGSSISSQFGTARPAL